MSEMISYKCPNTLELVIFDSAKNYCPHCNCEHLYPNAISRKKDNKWHKIKGCGLTKQDLRS